ncbi:MAG: CDP-alcohol phosphatidyltransferase family protein [Carbonactinosporaceae bacterium]
MSAVAIVFATAAGDDGSCAAGLRVRDSSLAGNLFEQLRGLGVQRGWVLTRPAWAAQLEGLLADAGLPVQVRASSDQAEDLRAVAEIVEHERRPVVLAAADVLTHREALAGLLADTRVLSGILAAGGRSESPASGRPDAVGPGSGTFGVRAERGRVVSAASPYHQVRGGNGSFLGVLKVDPRDHAVLARSARRLADLVAAPPARWRAECPSGGARRPGAAREPVAVRAPLVREDPTALLLVGLVRSGAGLTSSSARGLYWARPRSQQAVEAALEQMRGCDEDRVLLESSVKTGDGFFTTHFVSPYSKHLARWAARAGLTPNVVSSISMVIGVAAAAVFATGTRAGLVGGAVLLQVAFTTDCVDGQLARYTRTFSHFGAWLDAVLDRAKEYVVYAGLAVGAAVGFGDDVWVLAAAALILQTVRHAIDFSWQDARRRQVAVPADLPLEQPEDHVPGPPGDHQARPPGDPAPAARALGFSRGLDRWLYWPKRIFVLPIGERFALISVTAAVWNPRVTFLALLVWGGVALTYGLAGRFLRSVAR